MYSIKNSELNWEVLKTFLHKENGSGSGINWNRQIRALNEAGIAMEETLHFLFEHHPDEDTFKQWLFQKQRPILGGRTQLAKPVLTDEEISFFNTNGYLVLKGVVSKEACEDVVNAIYEFLGASPDDEESWYSFHPAKKGMMVAFSDHPALHLIRNNGRIRMAYEQLYRSTEIFATIDKVSFNPPERRNYHFMGSSIHWDVSLHQPVPLKFQGLLYLNDTTEEGGAFHCVPGFQHQIEEWILSVPVGIHPRDYASRLMDKAVPITGNTGDFVIWNQALPHCATPNKSRCPRLVQYLTYIPVNYQDTAIWI